MTVESGIVLLSVAAEAVSVEIGCKPAFFSAVFTFPPELFQMRNPV
jgi:hypothetical protein